MAARLADINYVVVADESPDISWLEQDVWADRLAEYHAGAFGFVGVQAVADIEIPYGRGWILERITSPGLWGIESDSGAEYFESVGDDERCTLLDMLAELCVSTDKLAEMTPGLVYA